MSIRIALTRISCGIHQIHGVTEARPEDIVESIKWKFTNFVPSVGDTNSFWLNTGRETSLSKVYPPAMIIFSDKVNMGRKPDYLAEAAGGDLLMKYINSHPELGTCTETPPVLNTNSTSKIVLYVWTLNPEFILKYWETRNKTLRASVTKAEKVNENAAAA